MAKCAVMRWALPTAESAASNWGGGNAGALDRSTSTNTGEGYDRASNHHGPKPSMMADAITPRPSAADGVVPKNGIGIAFWIARVPGGADTVKVEVPRAIAAGMS